MKKTVFVLVGLVAVGALAQVSPYAPIVSYDPFGWEATSAKIVRTLDYSGGTGAWTLYTAAGVAAPTPSLSCLGSQWNGTTWDCTGGTGSIQAGTPTSSNSIFYPSGFSGSALPQVNFSSGGSGSALTFGDVLDTTTDVTVCAVFRVMPTAPTSSGIIGKATGSAGTSAYFLSLSSAGVVSFRTYLTGSTTNTTVTVSSVPIGAWISACGTYDFVADNTSIQRLYVNGTAATANTTARGPIGDVATEFVLGGTSTTSSALNGSILSAKVWAGTAFSDADLQALERSQRGIMPNGTATPFTRSTVTTCAPIVGTSTMQTLGANFPCYTNQGVRLWSGYTNNVVQSEAFGTTWAVLGSGSAAPTVTVDQYAPPDGVDTTGDKVEFPATPNVGDYTMLRQQVTHAAGPVTCSVWARAHSGTATLRQYTVTTAGACTGIESTTCALTEAWSLCELKFTASAANYYYVFGSRQACGHSDLGAQTVGLWGAQCTATKFRAPYVKTTTAAVAASADNLSVGSNLTAVSPLSISVKYTSPDWNPATSATYAVPLALGADAANNTIVIRHLGDGSFSNVVQDNAGGTITTSGTPAGTTDNTEYWFTGGYTNAGAAKLYQTKTPFGTQSGAGTGVVNSVSATLYVGSSNGSSGDPGYYKKVNVCTGNNYKSCAR